AYRLKPVSAMATPNDSSLPRREFLQGAIALGALSSVAGPLGHAAADETNSSEARPAPSLIAEENSKEGALDWQLTRVRVDGDGFRSPWIEGYCSRQSVEAGDEIDIYVSTNPARQFRLEIFRMGYY